MSAPLSIELFNNWLKSGERGISSEAVVSALTGICVGQLRSHDYPHDPSDFRRCERVLRAVPEARAHLNVVAAKSPVWAGLVAEWDSLVALGDSEVPGIFDSEHARGSAPKLYARMHEIQKEAFA